MVAECDADLSPHAPTALRALQDKDLTKRWRALAQPSPRSNWQRGDAKLREALHKAADTAKAPTLGITGTGGAGKSSLTDELIRRLRLDQGDKLEHRSDLDRPVAPQERRRAARRPHPHERDQSVERRVQRVYMRSLATREAGSEISQALPDAIAACKVAGFDLVLVETSGIGQGDAAIVPHVDATLYVMTPEYGAASQLEKIDMLDFADFVAINKFDRKGAADALRDVAKQVQRNKGDFSKRPDEMMVFGTHGRALQRRRRHRALPGAAAEAEGAGAEGGRRAVLPKVGDAPFDAPGADRAAAAHALPGRDFRHRARLQEASLEQSRIARQRQQLAEARPHAGQPNARIENADLGKLAADRDARLDAAARSCWRCGRRCRRRMRATSTW